MLAKIQKLKNKRGFTLVELIVVVAIIAVLAAILVPLMGNYLNDAKKSSAVSASKTIKNIFSNAMTSAVNQDRGRAPGAAYGYHTVQISGGRATVALTGDTGNWVGGTTSQTEYSNNIVAQLVNVPDGSAIVGVVGSNVIGCAYIAGDVAPANMVNLIQDGSDTSSGFPDETLMVDNEVASTQPNIGGMIVGYC
ncbi:MAG: type II secretion system GspH family protein [Eubacterium sp.]|jgi:prepilin-type N-terminal cleavage/methylation domain-containing protein|nr:type II secretion system GspH family protein [Eubacterium sp.]